MKFYPGKRPFKVLKHFPTDARIYREGAVEHLDYYTARSLKGRGVVKPVQVEEPEGTEGEEGPEGGEAGPSETGEAGPSELKEYSADFLERAQEALESGNGNRIRSVLGEMVDNTSKRKAENVQRLAVLVDQAKQSLKAD